MPRFEMKEEIVIKVRGRMSGRGKINHVFLPGFRSRLYGVTLDEPNGNGLINIFALDNKICCKYGFGHGSYQIYKLEEA